MKENGVLISPELCLAMRCPSCQEHILYRSLSLFALRDGTERIIRCHCGSEALRLRLNGKHRLYMEALCPMCMESHSYIHYISEHLKPLELVCQETEIVLADLGDRRSVCEAQHLDHLELLSHQAELGDFFYHPQVTMRMLLLLNHFYRTGRLICSGCGGDFTDMRGFDIQVERKSLQIYCANCNSRLRLLTTRPSDLVLLRHAEKILLQPGKSALLFGPKKNQEIAKE